MLLPVASNTGKQCDRSLFSKLLYFPLVSVLPISNLLDIYLPLSLTLTSSACLASSCEIKHPRWVHFLTSNGLKFMFVQGGQLAQNI